MVNLEIKKEIIIADSEEEYQKKKQALEKLGKEVFEIKKHVGLFLLFDVVNDDDLDN